MFGGFSTALAAPYAYVPIREHDQVLVIDTATNALVETFTTGDSPEAAVIVGQRDLVYVSNSGDNTVSIINMVTHEVVGTIETNGIQPNVLVSDPTGSRLYVETVANLPSGFVSLVEVIDTASNSIVDLFPIPGRPAVNLGIDPTGRYLHGVGDVGTFSHNYQFFILEIATKSVIAQIPLDIGDGISRDSGDFVINPIGGTTTYIAHDDEIVIVDIQTKSIAERLVIPGTGEVRYLAINPTGTRLFATILDGLDSMVWVIDTSTNTMIDHILWESLYPDDLGEGFVRPEQIETDSTGTVLYVVTNNPAELAVVDATDKLLIGTIPFGFPEISIFGSMWGFVDHPDSDGDGLLDAWEAAGIDYNGDGTVDFIIPESDPSHKDLYVEIDWMELHKPDGDAIKRVIDAFDNAPSHSVNNLNGSDGVQLHVEVDEMALAHSESLMFVPCTESMPGVPDFDVVKSNSFGTLAERSSINSANTLSAKRLVYRYGLYVHYLVGTLSSGCAELPGNDFTVSLGGGSVIAGHSVGSTDQQAGTFMHELGHTLGLRHGGADNFNCKPNYLSVMNYAFQMNQLIADRPLDYSQSKLISLDSSVRLRIEESQLVTRVGVV